MTLVNSTSPHLYNTSAYVQKNQMLSRSLVDMFGIAVPWAVMANNKDEARERAIRFSIGFIIPYLTPFVTLPLSNRAALRGFKITKKYWSKNNPIIQISNEYLTSSTKLKEGLKLLDKEIKLLIKKRNIRRKKWGLKEKRADFNFERIVNDYKKQYEKEAIQKQLKLTKKEIRLTKEEVTQGAYEKLRKDLIKSKNSVLSSDLLFTSVLWSGAPWIANAVTKIKTGKTGFSAEYNEKNKELVEKRAEKHEKNKKKKYGIVLASCITVGTLVPLILASALRQPNLNKLTKLVAKHAKGFDYTEGIFMKKPSIFLMASCGAFLGSLLATRDQTELKDTLIRLGAVELLYFTGDGIISSILGRIIEKRTDLNLIDHNKKDLFWHKLFPPLKSMEKLDIQMMEAVEKGLDKKLINTMRREKTVAQRVYWAGMLGLMATLGFALPYAMNKLIKSDVKKMEKAANNFDNNEFLRQHIQKITNFQQTL